MVGMEWGYGTYRNGHRLGDIPSPLEGSSWVEDLAGSQATLELSPHLQSHRLIGELLRAGPGWKHWIMPHVNGVPAVAVSGLRCTATPGSWAFDGRGWEEYAKQRIVTGPSEQSRPQDWGGITYQLPLDGPDTWRAIMWEILTLYHQRPNYGSPPFDMSGPLSAGSERLRLPVYLGDVKTVGDLIEEITSRSDGVEIRPEPRWVNGTYPSGQLVNFIQVGYSPRRLIYRDRVVTFDTRATSPRWAITSVRDEHDLASHAWVAGGRGAGSVTVRGASGNLMARGWPQADHIDLSRGPIDDPAHVQQMAGMALEDRNWPSRHVSMTVALDAAQDPMGVRAGDWALIRSAGHELLPDGDHRMRVTRRSWSGTSPDEIALEMQTARQGDLLLPVWQGV